MKDINEQKLTHAVAMQVPQSAYVSIVMLDRAVRSRGHNRSQRLSTCRGAQVYVLVCSGCKVWIASSEARTWSIAQRLTQRTWEHLAALLRESFESVPLSSSSACSLWSFQRWSPRRNAACSRGSRPLGAPCVAAAEEERHRWSCGTIPGGAGEGELISLLADFNRFLHFTLLTGNLTLNKQNLRGLNLSLPFRSSRERNSMNWLMNTGSEKWSKMICSRC